MIKFLTKEQVKVLTGKVRYHAQVKALRGMGIDHRVRPDGRPIVLESDVATNQSKIDHQPKARLNLSAI